MRYFTNDRLHNTLLVFELTFLFLMGGILIFILISYFASKQGFVNEHKSQDSMFLFANNKSKPSCCNFSYSSNLL